MKKHFLYQRIWIRVFYFLPIAILVFLLQDKLIHKLLISDVMVYSLDGTIILLFLSIYYKVSEKYNWYIREGEYWVDKDILIFNMKGKMIKIKFCDIHEILMRKNNLLGSHHIILQIKWQRKKLKLISSPINEKDEIFQTQFIDVFNIIKTNSANLNVVKDIWGNDTDYWLKNI